MKLTASSIFFPAILALAVLATATKAKKEEPAVSYQNPLPACPPFCDEPNGGGETTKLR